MFRDITSARFQQIRDEAFQDTARIDSTYPFAWSRPARALWDVLAHPGNSVLEIGPGSGHLLAAARRAGCSVSAVEPGKAQRDFIRDAWSIDPVYTSIEEIPADRAFDAVVVNVFEQVHAVTDFLVAIGRLLEPGGTCYLSAPNAKSFEAAVLGTWWAACKVPTQVSFPSRAGIATAAVESGLRVERIWSSGLPLELPVSAAVAARDRIRASRGGSRPASSGGKAALAGVYAMASLVDPGYRLLGVAGRAGSLNATLRADPAR
jgi:SAM-dependent methyltransferase